MITEEEYKRAQAIIDQYHEEQQREVDQELEDDEPGPEPCPVCGEIEGMVNPCCANYDPLHYKNCGYG